MHWIFNKSALYRDGTAHLSLVSSGAVELAARDNEAIAEEAWGQLTRALPAAATRRVTRSVVVREHRATFSLAPGSPPRPPTMTPIPGFFLAGDWTDTGLPGTIEGAVLSGHRAADAVLGRDGQMTRVPGRKSALLIVAIYLALAFSIVAAGGFRAQDFDAHVGFLTRGLAGRWYLKGLTNPPLLYLFAAAMVRIAGWGTALSFVAATFALLNAVSLVILWRCAARVLSLRRQRAGHGVDRDAAGLRHDWSRLRGRRAGHSAVHALLLFESATARSGPAVARAARRLVDRADCRLPVEVRIHRRRPGGVRDGRRPGVQTPAPPGVGGGHCDVRVRGPHGGECPRHGSTRRQRRAST